MANLCIVQAIKIYIIAIRRYIKKKKEEIYFIPSCSQLDSGCLLRCIILDKTIESDCQHTTYNYFFSFFNKEIIPVEGQ